MKDPSNMTDLDILLELLKSLNVGNSGYSTCRVALAKLQLEKIKETDAYKQVNREYSK